MKLVWRLYGTNYPFRARNLFGGWKTRLPAEKSDEGDAPDGPAGGIVHSQRVRRRNPASLSPKETMTTPAIEQQAERIRRILAGERQLFHQLIQPCERS